MNLKDQKESKNFIDLSGLSQMLINYFKTQAQDEANTRAMYEEGPPGGYAKWITDQLNAMTPEEYKGMKEQGLSIKDLYMLRMMKRGIAPVDEDVLPNRPK